MTDINRVFEKPNGTHSRPRIVRKWILDVYTRHPWLQIGAVVVTLAASVAAFVEAHSAAEEQRAANRKLDDIVSILAIRGVPPCPAPSPESPK